MRGCAVVCVCMPERVCVWLRLLSLVAVGWLVVLVLRVMSVQSALSLSLITSHLTSGPQRGF